MSSGRYKAYADYKDSGIEWVGQIPSDWKMWKLAHAFSVIGSGTTPSSEHAHWYIGNIPWVTTGELRETVIYDTTKKVSENTIKKHSALRRYPSGSIAIAMYGATIGRLGIFGVEATTNQACCVLTDSKVVDNKYLYYWLVAFREDIVKLSYGGGQPNINQEIVASLRLSAPELPEQTQVSKFLDHETAKIDRLIEKQQALIALLKEKRQAVISHAVTKGLNPSAPLKDSGIEWLGQVPAHWIVRCIKHELKNLDYRRIPLSGEERSTRQGVFDYYGASGVIDKIDAFIFDEATILVGEDGANLVNRSTPLAFAAKGKYWVNNHAHILSAKDDLVEYWSEAIEHIDINPIVSGSAQPKLTAEALGSLKICFPPELDERLKISDFIHEQKRKFYLLIESAASQVTLLQERRTALISAAVTGKIDVRHWQPPRVSEMETIATVTV